MAAVIRVLYVDDEPDLLELCKMYLEESGDFSVTTIDSASAALVLLKKESFDAIVSDYLMPGMDGIRFLAEVRTRIGNIPFILFTGKGREEIVIEAIANGADFYLQKGGKPVTQFAELAHKIRAAVERRTSENALKESELRFRTMMDWTSDWEYWIGPNREFIYISPSVERITGYTPGEFTADPELIQRIIHPDDRARWEEHISLHAVAEQTDHSSEIEFRIIHRNGSPRWIGHTCRAIFNADGTWAGIRISNQDITDRKEAEEALRENGQRIIFSLESADIGAWDLDLMKHTAWRSLRHDQIFGYEELLPEWTYEMFLAHVIPEDKSMVDTKFGNALKNLLTWDFECRIRRKDGAIRWIWAKGRPEYNDRHEPTKMFGIVQDITERKMAEEQLRNSLAEKEVLLKEIHHRVKNNLQIVSGLMYLQSKLAKDPETKEILSACRNRITSMALLHENIFQVSNFSSVSMAPYINNLVKYLADSYDTTGFLTFKVDVPSGINLDIDTGIAIGMVVTELATNSIKFAFTPGEVGSLEVALHPSGEGMLLCVRDNGKGLPEGYDLASGPGLGMKLVTNLVSQVHGTMDVTSGEGTAISITFTSGIVTGKGSFPTNH